MKYRNNCKNSININRHQKKRLNLLLNSHFKKICKKLKKIGIKVNLYYTGSLARREPSIRCINNKIKLMSDIDFIFILEKKYKNSIYEKEIFNIFEDYKGKIENSIAIAYKEDIYQAKSFLARDLLLSKDIPVYKSLEIDFSTLKFSISKENYYESVISQAACYILNPELVNKEIDSFTFRESKYHFIKCALESLRGCSFLEGNNVVGFYSLYNTKFKNELNSSIAKKLIKARELSNYSLIPKINLFEIIYMFIVKYFGYDIQKVTSDEILQELINKSKKSNDIINSFQCSLIIFVLALNEKEQANWISAVKDILNNMDKSKVEICKELSRIQDIEVVDKITVGDSCFKEIADIMRNLRFDFIKELHFQNLGDDKWSDV